MIEKHSFHFIVVGVPAEKGLMINTKVFPSVIWPLLKTLGISLFLQPSCLLWFIPFLLEATVILAYDQK